MAELADARDLKSLALIRRTGSIPVSGTKPKQSSLCFGFFCIKTIKSSLSFFPAGSFTYAKPLTEKQMEDYELKPAPANPDRARPSITARLKDGARGQELPKEPSQKRDHKNHEER